MAASRATLARRSRRPESAMSKAVLPRGARRLLAATLFALATLPLAAQDRSTQREQFRAAYAAASRTPPGEWRKLAVGLETYPLYPYLEAATLRRNISKVSRADVEHFLARWPDTLAASDVRDAYLRELARVGDWATFRKEWKGSRDRDLQCNALAARSAAGEKLDYATDIEPLWTNLKTLPGACDIPLASARANGLITDERIWKRTLDAAAAGNEESAANAAAMLTGSDREAAERIVLAVRAPTATLAKADTWPDTPHTRDAIAYGLARYARKDSAASETLWAKLGDQYKWDDAQKNRVLNALAVYRSTSYSPDALARLKALPDAAKDDMSREWHVRVALASGDWNETLDALNDLSATQAADSRWRYLKARVLTKLGRKAEAGRALRRGRARSELPRLPRGRLDRRAVRDLSADARDRSRRREGDRESIRSFARVRIPRARHAARSAARMGFRAEETRRSRAPARRRSRLQKRLVRPRGVPPVSRSSVAATLRAALPARPRVERETRIEGCGHRSRVGLRNHPRRERMDDRRAFTRGRVRPHAAPARRRQADGEDRRRCVQPAERSVRSRAQRAARHRVSRPDGRQVRRQSVARERRIQRGRGAGRALARCALVARSPISSSRRFRTRKRANTSAACSHSV